MSTINGFLPHANEGGGEIATIHMPVATSQTIKAGYPVIIGTVAGKVYAGTSAAASILGVAAAAITTGTSPDETSCIPVWPAAPGNIFKGRADSDLAVGLRLKLVDIVSTSGDLWKVDVGTASTNVVFITDIPKVDTDAYNNDKMVYFKFAVSSYATPS